MERSHPRSRRLRTLARALGWSLSLVGGESFAQGNGVLTGTVVDAATQAPLSDVLVTATSPSLQGEQVVLSDATGTYRVPQLPSGTYVLRFEREDHRPFSRGGIELPPGYTLRFNAELIPEIAGATTIAVTGKPPLVDVASTQQGAVVDQDFIRSIPLSPPGSVGSNNRSFENVALTVPTARADQYGVALNGTTSPENSYLIDGLSTRNSVYGISGSQLSVEFVESVSVITGGYMPEYGRSTGGIIAANTRSGGNEFHGSVWGTWTPGALSGTPHAQGTVLSTREEPHNIVDFGVSLGGYIVKDRLWFFVGVQPEFSRYREILELNPFRLNEDGTRYQDEHGMTQVEPSIYSKRYFADEHQIQYFAKLTYLVSENHRIALTVTGTPSNSGGENAFGLDPRRPGLTAGLAFVAWGSPGAIFWRTTDGTFDTVLKLSSAFANKRVLLDVTAGWHHEDHLRKPADGSKLGSTDPGALINQPLVQWGERSLTEFENLPSAVVANCLSDGHAGLERCGTIYYTGGWGVLSNARIDSLQVRGVLTLLFQGLGHHLLKLGIDGEVSTFDHTYGWSGGAGLLELGTDEANFGGPFDAIRYGHLTGPDQVPDVRVVQSRSKTALLGAFVQDSWSILDRITLNLGLRFDTQTLWGAGDRVALTFPQQWSPRVGLVWDVTQQGRSKVYASYARYYENVPLDLADRAFGHEIGVEGLYAPASGDCNPKSSLTSSCASPDKLIQGAIGLPPNSTWIVSGGDQPSVVDPAIKPPSEDEFVAGLEYEIMPNTRASVSFTHRNIVHWVEDMSTDNGISYFIGNPGEGVGTTFPGPVRVYNSFVVSLDKVYANLWLTQISYAYQNLHGNLDGLFRAQTGQLDPNINADFDIQRLTINRLGPLAGDIRHTVKAYLAKQFVILPSLGVTLGAGYVGASGPPIDFLGASAVTGGYRNGYVSIFPRGAAGRLGWVHTIDLNGAVTFRPSADTAITLSVNVFNLFNFQQVTRVANQYTTWPNGVSPIPNGNPATDKGKIVSDRTGQPLDPALIESNFLQPTRYQPVRQVRFQARVSF
jgi:outer membrane receptor protein involved in Fe transport